jgi:hypothetical protein
MLAGQINIVVIYQAAGHSDDVNVVNEFEGYISGSSYPNRISRLLFRRRPSCGTCGLGGRM